MGEDCGFYFVAAGCLCSCPRTRLIVLCVSFRALLQEAKTDVISFLVFSQIGLLVFLLSLDLVLSREEQQCGSIVVGITASCDTAYNWAFFLWCTIPVFPPSWLLLWCSFLLNCGWHLPSYFSANCPYAVDLRLASLRFLVSGLSERLAWAPLVLLLEQLVPIWDREDAANEVKQLALVWSSKHTHGTVKQRERERVWLEQNKRYSAWRGGRDTPNEIRKEWGK